MDGGNFLGENFPKNWSGKHYSQRGGLLPELFTLPVGVRCRLAIGYKCVTEKAVNKCKLFTKG